HREAKNCQLTSHVTVAVETSVPSGSVMEDQDFTQPQIAKVAEMVSAIDSVHMSLKMEINKLCDDDSNMDIKEESLDYQNELDNFDKLIIFTTDYQ
ncbi:hypothetical protein ACJMK2_018225, partial [Sinanodonta woodiana]